MTTVAYRAGIMAADSGISCDGAFFGDVKKMFRMRNGALVGFAGSWDSVGELHEILMSTAAPRLARLRKLKSVEALIARTDGTIWCIDCGENGKTSHYQMLAEYCAIGSGFKLALGAMAAGASAEMAVLAAAAHDTNTKGPVVAVKVKGKK